MIIEFPKKYDVAMYGTGATIAVPVEYRSAAIELLKAQPWIDQAFSPLNDIHVYISDAYEISSQQAHAALCQLCEYVMSPPVEVDREVWGDALGEVG